MKARNMPFDTLRFANRMKAAGMEPKLAEEQAEALAEAMHDSLEAKMDNLVTKDFLRAELTSGLTSLRTDLTAELASLRTDLTAELASLRTDLTADLASLRTDLTADLASLRTDSKAEHASLRIEIERSEKRLGRMVITSISAFAIIIGLMQHFHI